MKIAIAIGHSRDRDKGAVSTGNVSEWNFNLPLGEDLRSLLTARCIPAEVIHYYKGGSYSAAMRNLAAEIKGKSFTHAVELHFNAAASPQANGHEFLYWKSSANGRALATSLAGAFQESFPFSRPRANGGVKPLGPADRGALFLRLTHCPAVILEPFFGSCPEEWDAFSTRKLAIAAAYAEGIAAFLED